MTLRDLLESGITFEGCRKIQCWETDGYPEVYFEGEDFIGLNLEKYGEREIAYIFPYNSCTVGAAICVELKPEEV